MQTHTAGLNIMPAGMWLILCYTSIQYNKDSHYFHHTHQVHPRPRLHCSLALFFTSHWLKYWFDSVVNCTKPEKELYWLAVFCEWVSECVCVGQWGSACLAVCHFWGLWARWSPGSCCSGLVWQVINRAQNWTSTPLAALTHRARHTYFYWPCKSVCAIVYCFPEALHPGKTEGTRTTEKPQLSSLCSCIAFSYFLPTFSPFILLFDPSFILTHTFISPPSIVFLLPCYLKFDSLVSAICNLTDSSYFKVNSKSSKHQQPKVGISN